jgi:hypothetical protein
MLHLVPMLPLQEVSPKTNFAKVRSKAVARGFWRGHFRGLREAVVRGVDRGLEWANRSGTRCWLGCGA